MIRYKEKEFKQWSICPGTGDIFDAKTGEVQKVKTYQGRLRFNGMPVHAVMTHTFYGYKPGYDIHHLDENKFNNALSNLVYLTRGEHVRLHTLGKPHSEEQTAKIAAAHKGNKMSEAHKAKLIAALKDSHWYHLPSGKNKLAKCSPGPEWIKGRSFRR